MRTKVTFAERARREQIVDIAIDALAEHGTRTTFARIVAVGGLSSPGLISYHFRNRTELLEAVLARVGAVRATAIGDALAAIDPGDHDARLDAVLTADLAPLAARPQMFAAAVEAFHELRTDDGRLRYLGDDAAAEVVRVFAVLDAGRAAGAFPPELDAAMTARILDGAKTQFLATMYRRPELDVDAFAMALMSMAHAVASSPRESAATEGASS